GVLPRRRGDAVPVLLAGGIFVAAAAIVASPVGLDTLIRSYGSSVGDLFAPGARDDPATIGEGSATMLWMPALLYRVFSFAPGAVPAINLAVIAAMICVVVLVILRCREDGRVLLVVSAFALLTSYHRVYDSVLLLPGIAWLIDRGRHGYEREHLLLASLLLPFLLPGPAILQVLLPEGVRNTWAAYALAIPHQTWCLVAVLVVASFGVVVEVVASVGRAGTIPKIAALGFLLSVANVQVAQGVHRSSFPAFAVRVEGGALREYRTPVSPGDAAQ